jgi:hypothetical protein
MSGTAGGGHRSAVIFDHRLHPSTFWPLERRIPGSGNITLKGYATSNRYVAWSLPAAAPYNPSPLVYRDKLYLLSDRGSLACYEATTGKEEYGRQRLSPERAGFAHPGHAREKSIA